MKATVAAGAWLGVPLLIFGAHVAADASGKTKPVQHDRKGVAVMELESPAFKHNGAIPKKCTCEGGDVSPALRWSNPPAAAKSLALIVDDPDAPDPKAPKMTWVHWVLFNIPVDAKGLPEGGSPLPAGTQQGLNDWKRTGYGGPCPPIGRHRYFHKLFALDTRLDLERPTKAQLEAAMRKHVIAKAELVGMYEKQQR